MNLTRAFCTKIKQSQGDFEQLSAFSASVLRILRKILLFFEQYKEIRQRKQEKINPLDFEIKLRYFQMKRR